MSDHYHIQVTEQNGQARRGALATTHQAAREEADIERAGGRTVDIEPCDSNCFGSRK